MLDSLISTAGAMGGSLLGYQGQRETNAANVGMANAANEMTRASSREQMQFQARMAKNAHLFEMRDLKRAGLNPLLAATGGADTPGGSSAQAQAPQIENAMGQAVATAMEGASLAQQLKKGKQEIENLKSTKANTDMDTLVKSKGIPAAEMQNELWKAGKPLLEKVVKGVQTGAKGTMDLTKKAVDTISDLNFKKDEAVKDFYRKP